MREEIKALSKYRLSRSRETLMDATKLLSDNSINSAINRFYYAAFYAARALLATKGLDSSKHRGVFSLFQDNFVKTGIIDKESSKALQRSFELRQDADYEDFMIVSEESVRDLRKDVESFIIAVEKALDKLMTNPD